MATLDVKGLRETVRGLERLGVEVTELKDVMRSVGDLVVPYAREGIRSRSGTLAGTVRAGTAKAKATIRAGGARARYAGINNYSPNIAGGPRHWMENAAEHHLPQITSTVDNGLRALARRAGLT